MDLATPWDRLTDFIERLARIGDLPADDADLLVRKHALAVTMIGLMPATLIWVVIGGLIQQPLLAWGSAAFFVVLIVGLGAFTELKAFIPVVRALLFAGLAYVALGHVALGGMNSGGGALVWGVLAPVSAVLYFDTGSSLRWFGAYAAMVVAAVVLDGWLSTLAPAAWEVAPVWLFAYNLLGPALIVLFLIRYVDGQRLNAQLQTRSLLADMLPAAILDRLARGERLIADTHASVTVMFADVVNFTGFATTVSADDLLLTLNQLFSIFDRLAHRHGLEKIKTMGDSYIAVAGAPVGREDHAAAAVRMAVEMHREVALLGGLRKRNLQLRIGLASGPVTAGVIGRHRYAYDLWGDTVNVASRMESSGVPGRIQLAASAFALLGGSFPATQREMTIKGKGPMRTYLVDPAEVDAGVRPVFPAPGAAPVPGGVEGEESAGTPAGRLVTAG
ncbi:MAG: adenylate/guanylate cyclase domain-containing protein [Candidatus Limnocylindria bacterium]